MRLLKFAIIIFIVSTFSITSCKKSDIAKSPIAVDSTTIMGFKDSAQLVKSISSIDYDSLGNFVDSGGGTGYFYYDTINKKVIVANQFVSSVSLAYSSSAEILSYNNNGLLIQDKFNPADTIGNGGNYSSSTANIVDYTYDAQNILSSQTITNFDGSKEVTYITKTSNSSGGYTLTSTTVPDPLNNPSDSVLISTSFDAEGEAFLAQELNLPDLSTIQSDSIIYDASGNIMKVIEYGYTGYGNQTYNLFQFSARDTKGNQLYNLNSILFNGVTGFDFILEDPIVGSGLSGGVDNCYLYQFTKYPALSTKLFDFGTENSYITINPSTQYDSMGRLVKYRMFNVGADNSYSDLILTYYK